MEQGNIVFMAQKCVICLHEPATQTLGCGHSCVCDNCIVELKYKYMKCPLCQIPIQKHTRNSHEIIEVYPDDVITSQKDLEKSQAEYIAQVDAFNEFIRTLDFSHYTKLVATELENGCILTFHSHTHQPIKMLKFKGTKAQAEVYVSYCRANFNRLAIEDINQKLKQFKQTYGSGTGN